MLPPMIRRTTSLLLALASLPAWAAEVKFDFASTPVNEIPDGFRSALPGEGQPGQWKIVLDAKPSSFQSFTPEGAAANRIPVLAQLSSEANDERFPVFIYDKEEFGDFTFSARVKIVGGLSEQMGGLIFRAQDEKNFYVFRANAKDGNARFYTVKDGKRTQPIGNNLPVKTNHWHELKVECQGNRIRCFFDAEPIGAFFTDSTFRAGKVGFWTMSDSVSYFYDAKVVYTPKQVLAQTILEGTMEKYSRLLGLRIYAVPQGKTNPEVVAANNPKDLGLPGDKTEKDILANGSIYHDRGQGTITVFMPMHDCNGDPVAVARITMRTFWGQTEQNALARALPVVKHMEAQYQTKKELIEW